MTTADWQDNHSSSSARAHLLLYGVSHSLYGLTALPC